jgi:autotransporter translocation and assembly factor TamB
LRLAAGVDLATLLDQVGAPDSLNLGASPWTGAIGCRGLDLEWLLTRAGWKVDEVHPRAVQDAGARDLEAVIRIIRPEMTIEGAYDAVRPEGIVNLDLQLAGTPRHPRLDLQLGARDAAYRLTRLDSLTARLDYRPGALAVRDLNWLKEGLGGSIQGRVPLELSLYPLDLELPDDGRDVDLHLAVPRGNLAVWSSLSELLQEPAGTFEADLRIRGPLHPPTITGHLSIKDGSLRLPLREERLEQIQAELRMDSLGVHLERVEARLDAQGRISAGGRFKSLEDMDMHVKVREGLFFETGVYRVEADGDFRIVARVDSLSGQIRPHVDGDAYIREAMILDITPRKMPGPVRPTPWLITVAVDAPANIMVTQPTTQLMLGNGRLFVSERDNWWNLSGGIDVQGGWYRVFNNQFTVQDGSLEFQDTGAGIEVTVDLQAETQVTEAPSTEGDPVESVTVKVDVTGRADELQVTLSSEPELSREEIIELLSFGRIASRGSGTVAASEETRDYLISEIVARLENQLSEEIPWLNRVRVAPDMDQIIIQPILSPQFSLNYAQELSSAPAQEVTMHYRLSNILYLKAGVLREPIQGGHADEEYNLDLKFRIEYE